MPTITSILSCLQFVLLCLPILVGPWLFGAWEAWWCWSFVLCIAAAASVFSLRIALRCFAEQQRPLLSKSNGILLASTVPFLLYAVVRVSQSHAYMDAERSLLLFVTPLLVAFLVVAGCSQRQTRLLHVLLVVDLALLGAYGLINHLITKSQLVMWLPGYEQYCREVRMTGSYFCPDHFAGIMELAFCLCLGWILSRDKGWRWKVPAAAISVVALVGVVMSKSRGGGITVLLIALLAWIWGFSQWPPKVRFFWRLTTGAMGLLLVLVFCLLGDAYIHRFTRYAGWQKTEGNVAQRVSVVFSKGIKNTCRGRMYGGAIRAWKSNPVWGIGPGMHRNQWPRFAATDDGDREVGRWPTQTNHDFHSYEVHSDWLQLLEEYGAVGLVLFLIPVVMLLRRSLHWFRDADSVEFASALGAFLALGCMLFHSLGDFNLQMPATTWVLAAIIAIPLRQSNNQPT